MLVFLIALTLWFEARSEGPVGRRLVASVIWNRSGGDISMFDDVILAPKQFSCWNERSFTDEDIPAEVLSGGNKMDREAWLDCVSIAKEMIHMKFIPTTTANIYYNPDLTDGCPKAFKDLRVVTTYKKHIFLEE